MPASPKRKRHSAFDDFPAERENFTPAPASLEAPAGAGAPAPTRSEPPIMERIERLRPSQMLPDRFQPRRLLPASIREPFFSGQIDCYQAAERWLALARQDKAHRNVVDRLLVMGASFDDHGQIKPITGSWVSVGANQPGESAYVFLIETGERRFWAACLTAIHSRMKEEPLLRVEVVSRPSRQRQVLENRHAEMPSAVGQACEIAALILAEMGLQPTGEHMDEFDYFRVARAQRMPAGLWEKLIPVMQLTRPRMVQLLNILQLPTPLLEMADRYRLPERVLREVLALPAEQWERAILVSIQNHLASSEVAEAAAAPPASAVVSPVEKETARQKKSPGLVAASDLRRFANTIQRLDRFNQAQALDELADEMVVSGEADDVLTLLEELAALISARLQRQ